MEEKVMIPGPEATLEGRWSPGKEGGVVIAHPHPLFGGSMDNNVVWTARQAFQARGWATLRFNFRGVGRSSGTYGGGSGEIADLAAALGWLIARNLRPGYLVGYSFGAYVAAQALAQGLEADGALLISPPLAFMDLAILPQVPRLALIVAGDRDELCPVADLQTLLSGHPNPPEVKVVPGTDHFFGGCEDQLFQILRDYPLPSRGVGSGA
ncbi:MAG: alpha/beta hydrolase [Desulfobacteraceae bacterium]